MSDVISIFRPTKKDLDKLKALEESPPTLGHGFRDDSDKYSGKLREAMKVYGSFKGFFRSKK